MGPNSLHNGNRPSLLIRFNKSSLATFSLKGKLAKVFISKPAAINALLNVPNNIVIVVEEG